MDPTKLIEIIESGNLHQIYWVVGVLVVVSIIQFVLSYGFGEKLKNSISSQYSKSLEMYKDELLRRKLIYEEQLSAYKHFSSIMYTIYPDKIYPEMEWNDALHQIAMGFSNHYKLIKEFQMKYSSILPDELRNKVDHCSCMCTDGRFEVSSDEISTQGYKYANELWGEMEYIDKQFRILLKIDPFPETGKTVGG